MNMSPTGLVKSSKKPSALDPVKRTRPHGVSHSALDHHNSPPQILGNPRILNHSPSQAIMEGKAYQQSANGGAQHKKKVMLGGGSQANIQTGGNSGVI